MAMFEGDANGYPQDLVDTWIRDGIQLVTTGRWEGVQTVPGYDRNLGELLKLANKNAYRDISERVRKAILAAETRAWTGGLDRNQTERVAAYVKSSAEAWEYNRWKAGWKQKGGSRKRTTRRKRRSS